MGVPHIFQIFREEELKNPNIEFTNSEEELIERFEELAKKYWRGKVYLVKDEKSSIKHLRVVSQEALADISKFLSHQDRRDLIVRIPDEILFSDKDVCRAFIAGILDTDGSIMVRNKGLKRVVIEFSTKSLALANSLSFMLKRLRIPHTLSVKTIRGASQYVIMVYDEYAKKLLDLIDGWSLKAKRYKDVVTEVVKNKKCSSDINVFPVGPYLRKVRTTLGLSEEHVEEELGISSRYLYIYERNTGKTDSENLKRLYEYYRRKAIEMKRVDVITMLEKLRKLLEGDLVMEEILAIEEVEPTNDWLYDLEVEKTHLFVIGQVGWRLNHNTTLLNAIATLIPLTMKVVVVEEVREVKLPHPNVIYMVTKEGVDEIGKVTLFDLVKASLRQRPDYIVVGEIRGEEAYVLMQAISLGHGGLSTMHAEGPMSAVKRLMAPPMNIPPYLVKLLDLVIHITKVRGRGGVRRFVLSATEIADIDLRTHEPSLNTIYKVTVDIDAPDGPKSRLAIFRPEESLTLRRISDIKGIPLSRLVESVRKRTEFLKSLAKKKLSYDEVVREITMYRE